MQAFELERPADLKEAVELLKKYEGRAAVKAGGTDLLIWIKKHLVHPDIVVDISGIKGLDEIAFDSGKVLRFGAMVTANALGRHPEVKKHFPIVAESCMSHSDELIRNKATVIGNICAAVPSGDMIPAFAVHEAVLEVVGPGGSREIPYLEFVTGPRKTTLKPGEIVTGAVFRAPEGRHSGCYLKVGRRNALDIAQVGAGCLAIDGPEGRTYRLSYSAVAARPVRATEAEKILRGTEDPDETLLSKAAEAAKKAVSPISDIRAGAGYRTDVVGDLTVRVVRICAARL